MTSHTPVTREEPHPLPPPHQCGSRRSRIRGARGFRIGRKRGVSRRPRESAAWAAPFRPHQQPPLGRSRVMLLRFGWGSVLACADLVDGHSRNPPRRGTAGPPPTSGLSPLVPFGTLPRRDRGARVRGHQTVEGIVVEFRSLRNSSPAGAVRRASATKAALGAAHAGVYRDGAAWGAHPRYGPAAQHAYGEL